MSPGAGTAVSGPVAGIRTVTLAQRPELAAAIPAVLESRWPRFMLAGKAGHDVDLTGLLAAGAPDYQVVLIDAADTVLGVGLSAPLWWDGTVDGLPGGWDDAVTASADLLRRGGAPNTATALSITIAPHAAGQGHAVGMIRALKAAAALAGGTGLLAPVRPVLKARYPLTPIARYADWRTPAGEVFDPWLRRHLGLGARVLTIAHRSLTITGTVAQWEGWAGLALPDDGEYVISGGLVPLTVDRLSDRGIYREPNVWVLHPGS